MDVRKAWLFRGTRLAVGVVSGRNSCVSCQSVVCQDRLAIALLNKSGSPRWCHPYCFANAFRIKRQPWWINKIVIHRKFKIRQHKKMTLQRKVTTRQHNVTKAKIVLTKARIELKKTVRQLKASQRRQQRRNGRCEGCEGCKTKKKREAFGADMWHNGQNKKRKMICLACAGRGKSLHDIGLYTCEKCGMTYGHQKFVKHDLGNLRRLDRMKLKTKILCIDCKLSVRQEQGNIKKN